MRENQKRRGFDYAPQQRVLKKKWKPRKLDERTCGLYKIVQTHVNGTVTIQLRPGLTERINIRRIIPYRQWSMRKFNINTAKLPQRCDIPV